MMPLKYRARKYQQRDYYRWKGSSTLCARGVDNRASNSPYDVIAPLNNRAAVH